MKRLVQQIWSGRKRGEYAFQTDTPSILTVGAGLHTYAVPELAYERVAEAKEEKMALAALLRDGDALCRMIGVQGDAGLRSRALADPMMGCDPELFLRDDAGLVPAFDVLPPKGGEGPFWDGFQAEFVTKPSQCLMRLAAEVFFGLQSATNLATNMGRRRIQMLEGDSVALDHNIWAHTKPEHSVLGCDPSFNLYGMGGDIPADGTSLPYRFAGGHIHIGHSSLRDKDFAVKVVYNLDRVLGVWGVGAAQKYDQKVRRKYYGLAGEFRLPDHGLEYRTLSNFWLRTPPLFYVTFEIARMVFQATRLGLLDFWVADQMDVIQAINEYDVSVARKILLRNEKLFCKLFEASNLWYRVPMFPGGSSIAATLPKQHFAKKALQVGIEGMEIIGIDRPVMDEWYPTPGNRTWGKHVQTHLRP